MLSGWTRKALFVPEVVSSTACPGGQELSAAWMRAVSKAVSEDGSPEAMGSWAAKVEQAGGNDGSTTARRSCASAASGKSAARAAARRLVKWFGNQASGPVSWRERAARGRNAHPGHRQRPALPEDRAAALGADRRRRVQAGTAAATRA